MSEVPYAEPAPLDHGEHAALVEQVAAAAAAGPDALRLLWDELRATVGSEAASRLWQEGLAQLDASQQT
jgi:hypothetical protein